MVIFTFCGQLSETLRESKKFRMERGDLCEKEERIQTGGKQGKPRNGAKAGDSIKSLEGKQRRRLHDRKFWGQREKRIELLREKARKQK